MSEIEKLNKQTQTPPDRREKALARKLQALVQLELDCIVQETEYASDIEKALEGLHGAAREARHEVIERIKLVRERAKAEGKARKIGEAFAHTLVAKHRKTARWRLGFIRMRGGGPRRRGHPWYAEIQARRKTTGVTDFEIDITHTCPA